MTLRVSSIVYLTLVGIVALTFAVYWQGLSGPFLLDDSYNVVDVYMEEFNWSEVVYSVTHNSSGMFGRPIPVLSFIFSGLMHGPESWGFKFHNLLLHVFNGLLVFVLFTRILPYLSTALSRKKISAIGLVLASCWLLHPIMVSSVLYVVQRMAQLSAFFTLLALLSYVVARENAIRKAWLGFIMGYFFLPISLILALLSKESGALIPFYILAIEMLVFQFTFADEHEKRRVMAHLAVFVAIPFMVGGYYILTHLDSIANYSSRDFSLIERLMTQLHVVPFYLKLIFFPQLSQMSLYHDDAEVIRQAGMLTITFLGVLLLSLFAIIFLRKNAPVLGFGIAWFLISHLMESTFIGLELVFEHRNYLAAAGPIFVLSYYLLAFPKFRFQAAIPLIYVVIVAFLTWVRVQEWRSEEMIYTMAIQDHPGSFRAQVEYANLMYTTGRFSESLEHLDMAIEIKSKDFGPVLHKAAFICNRPAEEVESLIAVAIDRAAQSAVTADSLNSLEFALRQSQKPECTGLSFDGLLRVAQTAMVQADTSQNIEYLGYLQRIEGHVLMLQGHYVEAVDAMLNSYNNVKILNVLIELVDMQINVGRLGDAGVVLARIETLNNEQFGVSTSRVDIVKNKLIMALDSIANEPQ